MSSLIAKIKIFITITQVHIYITPLKTLVPLKVHASSASEATSSEPLLNHTWNIMAFLLKNLKEDKSAWSHLEAYTITQYYKPIPQTYRQ